MPLIKEIENTLPLVARLPEDWQKDAALLLSKIVVAYDNTLTLSPAEQREQRDQQIEAFMRRYLKDDAEF